MTVRVALPPHLCHLAGVGGQVELAVEDPPTIRSVLDALERAHPVLRGTIRSHGGDDRRPLIRFFACGEDLSHRRLDAPLPEPVSSGKEILHVVGAIAGG